ncbi:hypothetical protein [Rhodococcus sp. KBS0724]|jgi:hypothetical protein|nr:hypothetical protein [Rhodococcus sp. KBS0724]
MPTETLLSMHDEAFGNALAMHGNAGHSVCNWMRNTVGTISGQG